jgi:transcriptional regulator with XRE-family HTH domain
MFDTKLIGKKIAALRKAKDMTQMELADKMFVSYQAVSNWERGNTMPDISKLLELSQILGVDVQELLGSEKETTIVNKIIDKSEDIKLEEVAEVAELMKPSQVEEAVEKASDEEYQLETLIALAPHLNSKRLAQMIDKTRIKDLSQIIPLAPFLESEQLASMIDRSHGITGSFDKLIALAPFLDEKDLSNFAERIFNSEKDAQYLNALAPFMDEKSLGKIAKLMNTEQKERYLVGLAPFIDEKVLTDIARDLMKTGKLKILKQLMPFIDEDEL